MRGWEENSECSTSHTKVVSKLSSTSQQHTHTIWLRWSTNPYKSNIHSQQCRRNGLQTANTEKLHCLFAMRYDAFEKARLLVRPPHVCHVSVTCLSHVWQMSSHNMHHVLQVNVSMTCPRLLVKADMPGWACALCLQVHHMQVKQREPQGPQQESTSIDVHLQKWGFKPDTSWPSSSSSSSECGKSSGDTKPVPVTHCLETCLIQALQ